MLAWEAQHPERLALQLDDGQFFGFQNASRGALQKHTTFVFIPAVREAAADAADGKTSVIGRLLELLVRSSILQRRDIQQFKTEMTARYQALVTAENMPELGMLASRITNDLKGLYQEAAVDLTWREIADFPVPLPVADVALSDDGFGGPVDRQGHGLQRAFIFTLLQHLARTSTAVPQDAVGEVDAPTVAVAQAPSLILAIEEPELYQHPTKQRHFAEVLRGLSSGALPGVEGPTQIVFASHSPMFVSLGKADEIRLVRRTTCPGSEFKQCALKALDLNLVVQKLERGWGKADGAFSTASLIPKLHILGSELSEGFFANGVVLVEGRSDRAALSATARLLGVSFEAAGIAILSAEGKDNLDRPLVVFQELGIPTFVIWDCDTGKRGAKPPTNLALLRLCRPDDNVTLPPEATVVSFCYAHFAVTLDDLIKDELTEKVHSDCLAAACEPFGISPNGDTQKIPEIMYQTLRQARTHGASSPTLIAVVKAIWLHIRGEEIPDPAVPDAG